MNNYNYEFLTDQESEHITKQINKLEKIKSNGLLTNKELQLSFINFLQENYSKHIFEIYTNTRTNFN